MRHTFSKRTGRCSELEIHSKNKKCKVVAGAANNQLATDEDGQALYDRGIVYAPDYAINAGGFIIFIMSARAIIKKPRTIHAAGILPNNRRNSAKIKKRKDAASPDCRSHSQRASFCGQKNRNALSMQFRKGGDKFGSHRVFNPKGVLPQQAGADA